MKRGTRNKLEEESKAAINAAAATAHTVKPKQVLKYVVTGCNFATELEALMNLHTIDHQLKLQAGPPPPPQPVSNNITPRSSPKLEQPKLNENATNEEWNMFQGLWCTYRTGSSIFEAVNASEEEAEDVDGEEIVVEELGEDGDEKFFYPYTTLSSS